MPARWSPVRRSRSGDCSKKGSCVKRAHLGTCVGAVAALALSPLAVTGTVHAAGSTATGTRATSSDHRADPSFGPAQRKAAVSTAASNAGKIAKALRLGAQQDLVVKNVSRDVDGVEHVHYDRTYQGLPVIGGDLIVHESAVGRPAHRRLRLPRSDQGGQHHADGLRDRGPRRPDRARSIYAAAPQAGPGLGVDRAGTAKDGTPIRDLVYTDARTGKQLAVDHRSRPTRAAAPRSTAARSPSTTTGRLRAGPSPTAPAAATRPTTPPGSPARPTTAPARCSPTPTTCGATGPRPASRAPPSTRTTARR